MGVIPGPEKTDAWALGVILSLFVPVLERICDNKLVIFSHVRGNSKNRFTVTLLFYFFNCYCYIFSVQ